MKHIKRIVISMMALAILFTLTACEGLLNDILNNLPDYEYSDDGISETNLFFGGVKSETFNGRAKWTFGYEDEEGNEELFYTMYAMTEGSNRKVLVTMAMEENELGLLNLKNGDEESNYYIDYKAKTVSQENSSLDMLGLMMFFAKYGMVEFDEENPQWEFAEKKVATIKDSTGKDIETVEFVYNGTGDEDIVMRINFRKTFPIIERIAYEITEDDETNNVSVYVAISSEVTADLFEIPSEEDGFVIVEEE